MNNKIGIVIVSYHNPQMTIRYVHNELSKIATPFCLVIVNNESTEKDCDALARACGIERKYVVCSKENIGYAKGNNLGVARLKEIGNFTHYLFSNDDIELKDGNVLDVLCSVMEQHEDVAAIGPRVVGLDGRDQNPHNDYISPYRKIGWLLLKPFRKSKEARIESGHHVAVNGQRTYWTSGAFMLVKANAFDRISGFDPATFLYFEEVILAERLKRIGKVFYYEPSQEVIHFEGGSTKVANRKKSLIEIESNSYYWHTYKDVCRPLIILYKMVEWIAFKLS